MMNDEQETPTEVTQEPATPEDGKPAEGDSVGRDKDGQVASGPPSDAWTELHQVHEAVRALGQRLHAMEETIGNIEKQVSYLPPQVRRMGTKVEGMTSAISEPRYRAVLLSLLGIYDLVDQLLRALPAEQAVGASDHARNYEVLRAQLLQILEANGLSRIPTDGAFDPELHRAVESVPCEDPGKDNQVLDVVRPGFRTEQTVLRFAEVTVGRHEPPETAPAGPPDETSDDRVEDDDVE